MSRIRRYTLVTDGSSDDALVFPIDWLLREHGAADFKGQWADLRQRTPSAITLMQRLKIACDEYPCDLLFVHRDAERNTYDVRATEIRAALRDCGVATPHVCVVPVRMMEAWLLHDPRAIRTAAGNPNGRMELHVRPLSTVERLPDPKRVLKAALLEASGAVGRRRKRKERDFPQMRRRVAELVSDWHMLRILTAFQRFESDLAHSLRALTP